MKTHIRAWLAPLTILIASAQAQIAGAAPSDDLRIFATCAGRLSALREHQWLIDPAASGRTDTMRDAMLSLVDALQRQTDAVQVMQWRLEAKVAQRDLLTRAAFTGDGRAARAADALISGCAALIGQS